MRAKSIALIAVALAATLLPAGVGRAGTTDCFDAPWGGTIPAGETVNGNLSVTRQDAPADPRGSVCVLLGEVHGNVKVEDDSAGCASRPPFTALEVIGGTIGGNVTSEGGLCAMIWLRDGATVDGNVTHGAEGNLGFLGNSSGASVDGNVHVKNGFLWATGSSTTNEVAGNIKCSGDGTTVGSPGTGDASNWDGLVGDDLSADGSLGGKYDCHPKSEKHSAMFTLPDAQKIDGAHAVLRRRDDRIETRIEAADLTPGDVVTLWWVIFNNPEACTVGFAGRTCGAGDLGNADVRASVLYGGGDIADEPGRARYDSTLIVGEDVSELAIFGPGILWPHGAEVHVVLRTHRDALHDDPELLASQLSTFDGGCATSTLPDGHPQRGEPGPNEGCANIQFGAFPVG